MSEPDLSGVDPSRRAEVRRRVRLVTEYLGGPPTAARREAAAAEMGVTPGQFLRLARIWRETGSAARLHGAGASPRPRRPTRSIDPAVEAVVDAAIAALGADARFVDVKREVARRCAADGLATPADATVYDRLNRRRGDAPPPADGARAIAIVRCSPRFPITYGGVVARPTALLAVAMPEGLVVAAEIGVDGRREPDLGRLVRRLVRLSSADAPLRPLVAQSGVLASAGERSSEGVPIERSAKAATIVSRIFGQRLGDLRITGGARSDRAFLQRAAGRLNVAPPLVEATSLLLRAIEAHNRARGSTSPPAFSLGRSP